MSRVERLKELFDAAVAQPPAARDAFLERACGTDAALRAELEALIACDAGTLAPSAADPLAARVAAAAAAQFDATAPWLGRRIGNYRIVGELGQGGMGSVYLAERADREYQARVAIKLIRGFPTQAALERLRRERQVLAGSCTRTSRACSMAAPRRKASPTSSWNTWRAGRSCNGGPNAGRRWRCGCGCSSSCAWPCTTPTRT